ncbi:hypothetical protein B6U99_05965, partial [Candidatus Geothermarchaeota archaeon ex4572_27]
MCALYVPPVSLPELDAMVRAYFEVVDWGIEMGAPYYVVRDGDLRGPFKALYERLSAIGLAPALRRERGRVVLRVVPLARRRGVGRVVALALFIATLATVAATGYLLTVLDEVLHELDASIALNPLPHLIGYAVAMMGVVGVHELGHKLACRVHGIKASPPYFIPFPPIFGLPIGTLGAVILQETPPLNRDELFDIGMAGPLMGFIASIAVSAVGIALSYPVSPSFIAERGGVVLPTPLIYEALIAIVRPDLGRGQLIYLHPVAWAGWVGFLITFLNTFPVGQLDGGHVLRAAMDEKAHLVLSIVFVVVMALTGFVLMAIIAAILALRRHPGALDDVS